MIQTISGFLNSRGAKQVFMQDLAQYVYARTKSTLTQASFNGTNITYTFTGKAADPDGNLVSTQILVFNGDTEGVWQTVPGFSNGMVTSLAPPPAPPTVVSVNPTSGSTAGGTTITISGAGFTSASTVKVGGNNATGVSFVDSSTLMANTPAGAQGAADVTVSTVNGTGTLKLGFNYVGPPVMSRISPTSGPSTAGNTINIHGSSFTPGSQVTIGGIAASNVTFIDTTRISAIIPAGTAGTSATVAVTTPFGSASMANAYTYIDPTTILMQDSFNGDST